MSNSAKAARLFPILLTHRMGETVPKLIIGSDRQFQIWKYTDEDTVSCFFEALNRRTIRRVNGGS
jgi:hypothetical protein